MEMEMEVKFKLKSKVNGKIKEITLDKNEAKELFNELSEIFCKDCKKSYLDWTYWKYPYFCLQADYLEQPATSSTSTTSEVIYVK